MPAYDASDSDENGAERVAKALARAGVASRREVERLIEGGRVALNGTVLTTPAVKIRSGDILTVDGEVVGEAEPTRVFRYHKPPGLITSHSDPKGRPTVFAHLPAGLPRLLSVGRLDLNSEGLLLLTNDGALSRALELPSSGWTRVYRARAFGAATQEKLDTLKGGVTVEGVKYGPIEARLDKAKEGPSGRNVWITVSLTEGKNREVRRVLESLGLKVNRLIRLAYGPFALGTLAQGEVEEIGPRVIREQLAGLVEARNMPRGDRPQFSGGKSAAAPRRAPTPGRLTAPAPASAAAEAKPKTEYKAGWARPKAKPAGHAPSKRPKGPPKFERATAEGPRAGGERRRGRVMARAEDVLPGQTPRGPVKAPPREPVRRDALRPRSGPAGKAYARPDKPRGDARPEGGGKRTFVNPNDHALREAAGRGAARDAERKAAPPARGSGAHRTGRPAPRRDDDGLAPRPAPRGKGGPGGRPPGKPSGPKRPFRPR